MAMMDLSSGLLGFDHLLDAEVRNADRKRAVHLA